jgi:hypothetical protein
LFSYCLKTLWQAAELSVLRGDPGSLLIMLDASLFSRLPPDPFVSYSTAFFVCTLLNLRSGRPQ